MLIFFWFNQWLPVWLFLCGFFVSNIVLYFCLGASDTVEFLACWSAKSFPYISQCPVVLVSKWIGHSCFLFFKFSIWFIMFLAMSLVRNIFWMLLMVLESRWIYRSFVVANFQYVRADIMAMASAVDIDWVFLLQFICYNFFVNYICYSYSLFTFGSGSINFLS